MSGRMVDGAQSVDGQLERTEHPGAAAASPSVAGDAYRIVETAGQDGKQLLKLLPVSNILGNVGPVIHSPVVSDNTNVNASVPSLVSLKTMFSNTMTSPLDNIPTLLTAAPGKLILRKQLDKVELVKVTSVVNVNPTVTSPFVQNNYVSPDKLCLQKDTASMSSVKSDVSTNTKNLPLTVNSSILPPGHHLQIPANAEVKSVPASCLPLAVQQKILAMAVTNASVTSKPEKPPNIIYVSPVRTVKTPVSKSLQNINPTAAAEVGKPLVPTSAHTAVNSFVPDEVSCDSQNPQETPMKWVVQKNPQSSASCLVPVKSSNYMISKMLKTLAVRENMKNSPSGILPACSNSLSESQEKLNSVKDNALVLYNGKVYLLTRKGSSTGSAQDNRQTSATADTNFRKHTSQLTNSVSANSITNQVVNLVLSKNKGIALSAKDSKLWENVKPPLWPNLNKNLQDAPFLVISPQGNMQIGSVEQQEAVSASENIPVGIKVDTKTVTEENVNINIIQKTNSPETTALESSANYGASNEEEQKIEKINSTEMAFQNRQKKLQHSKQDTEIRKKFGLVKEERVYLGRIPLLNSVVKMEETEWSSNVPLNDSCHLLEAITVKPEPEEEETVLGKQESDIKRKAELPEPVLETAKRRKTSSPSLDHDDCSSVTNNPSSYCGQVISQQENATNSLQCSPSGGSDPNPCMQSNEESEVMCPALHGIKNDTSFTACSLGEDSFLSSPPDLEETIKDEKIERLKLLLKKQEEALEEMRKKLQET